MGALADKYRAKTDTGTSLADKYRVIPGPGAEGVRWDDAAPTPKAESKEPEWFSPESKSGAAVRGFGQGGTLGFSDEISGAMGAMDEFGARLSPFESRTQEQTRAHLPFLDALKGRYAEDRDAARREEAKAEEAHPAIYGATEVAGSLAVPIPGGAAAKGAGMGARVLRGAGQAAALGTAIGAGKSEAGDAGGVLRGALVTGGMTAPLGAAGGFVAGGLGKLGERFGREARAVETKFRADKATEALESAEGSFGHSVQDANRKLENLRTALADPATSLRLKADIAKFMETPEYSQLVEQVGRNTLEAAPRKLGEMATAKQAMADAPALASKGVDEYLNKSTLWNDVAPRAWHYAKPAIAAGLGGMAGGPLGAGAGAMAGAASGKPGRALANLMATPRFQIRMSELLTSGAALGEALGERFGQLFAMETTPQGRQKVLKKALEEDPDAEARVAAVLEQNQSKPKGLMERFGGR